MVYTTSLASRVHNHLFSVVKRMSKLFWVQGTSRSTEGDQAEWRKTTQGRVRSWGEQDGKILFSKMLRMSLFKAE